MNIVLLGGSNSIKKGALKHGLKEAIETLNTKGNVESKFDTQFNLGQIPGFIRGGANSSLLKKSLKEPLKFFSLALGATTSIQNLYELKRVKNKEILENAALIITESNVNEAYPETITIEKLPDAILYRNIAWYYAALYALKKPVVVILLPFSVGRFAFVNNIHRKFCLHYGFHCIDMQKFYQQNDLVEFGHRIDWAHPLGEIMHELGRNIIAVYQYFKPPKTNVKTPKNTEFVILNFNELEANGNLTYSHLQNSAFDEYAAKLTPDVYLKIPNTYFGFIPIALHTWNNDGKAIAPIGIAPFIWTRVYLQNRKLSLSKETNYLNSVTEINYSNAFVVDDATIIGFNPIDNAMIKEYHYGTYSFKEGAIKADTHCNLVAIMLAKGEMLPKESEYINLAKEEIAIPKEYNFEALIPPVHRYKTMIDEYCQTADALKFNAYAQKIAQLQARLKALGVTDI